MGVCAYNSAEKESETELEVNQASDLEILERKFAELLPHLPVPEIIQVKRLRVAFVDPSQVASSV